MLNLTWNEIAFVLFLFLLVWLAGRLPRLGDALGDFLHGYRTAGGKAPSAASESAEGDRPRPGKHNTPS